MENEQKGEVVESGEVQVLTKVEEQMEVLENSQEEAILSIYDNMDELLEEAKKVNITADSTKEEYEDVKKLWRTIKNTHVAVEKKREEMKKPILECGRKLDSFVKTIYDPMVKAEKSVRAKMKIFEDAKEKEKQARKKKEEEEKAAKEALDKKLKELNKGISKINNCSTKEEITALEEYFNSIDFKDYGERSDEAGFIVQNLLLTCKTVKNGLPSKSELSSKAEQPKDEPKIEPKEQPMEQSKDESKDEPKGQPKEQSKDEPNVEPKDEPKEQPKEQPKGQPMEQSKDEPKEQPKEQQEKERGITINTAHPKEQPMEQSKDESIEQPKEQYKEPAKNQLNYKNLELDFDSVAEQQSNKDKDSLKGSDIIPDYTSVNENDIPNFILAKYYYESGRVEEVRYKIDK